MTDDILASTPIPMGLHMGADSDDGVGSYQSPTQGIGVTPTPRVRASAMLRELQDCSRFCIFNIGSTTVDEAWSELLAMLPQSEHGSLVKLQRVTNASFQPRIDMWVRGKMVASLVRDLWEMTR